tara:strand:- start:867 stop:1226 length:360 start_codon:yes stop_codon:yes gene_type:complete
MKKQYDDNNVFAKILREEIPCKKVYENEYALSFEDINPQAPVHVLVIPKGKYLSVTDFSKNASDIEIAGLIKAIGETSEKLGLNADGYRILSNAGTNANQEVPHLHFHIFGGRNLGRML